MFLTRYHSNVCLSQLVLSFKHPLKKGRVKLQVLRSFTSKEDVDHDAGETCFAEVSEVIFYWTKNNAKSTKPYYVFVRELSFF